MSSRQHIHGLVLLDSMSHAHLGMNRSLLLASNALEQENVSLHFTGARSLFHLARGLLRGRRRQYDFVIFNSLASLTRRSPVGYPVWRFASWLGKPAFVYWHETDWVFDRLQRRDPQTAARVAMVASSQNTSHLVVSAAGAKALKKRYAGAQPQCIYECADVPRPFDRPAVPARPPIVLNVASIQPRKGTDLFVETAIQVCQRHPTVKFIWLGAGREYGTWRQEIASVGLEKRILFPGYIEAPFALLRRASLFFLSSRDDPFPLSVLEAMCVGRTVVTFAVGGAPEALGGEGILLEPFDTRAAAEAILETLSQTPESLVNQEVRERYLSQFTPEQFARRLARYLQG